MKIQLKTNSILIIFIFLTVFVTSCDLYQDAYDIKLKEQIINELINENGEYIDFRKFNQFEWNKIIVIFSDSGTSKKHVKELTNINHIKIGNHTTRFYFILEDKLVKYFDMIHHKDIRVSILGCNDEYHCDRVEFNNANFKINKYSSGEVDGFLLIANCE